jgi:1,4-alpha-glucan branching enzyme
MATFDTGRKMKKPAGVPPAPSPMREVEFAFHAPEAGNVCLAGKFNDWNASSLPMNKGKDGTWRVKVRLCRGKHEYKYFVDGAWASDLTCTTLVPNPFGTDNCVITLA